MFDSWVGKIPWRRERLPIAAFLPGGSQGQRSLVGYSLRGHKKLDRTGQLALSHGVKQCPMRNVIEPTMVDTHFRRRTLELHMSTCPGALRPPGVRALLPHPPAHPGDEGTLRAANPQVLHRFSEHLAAVAMGKRSSNRPPAQFTQTVE